MTETKLNNLSRGFVDYLKTEGQVSEGMSNLWGAYADMFRKQ
jgi:hypothetical protein